jgi:hypothetical protein
VTTPTQNHRKEELPLSGIRGKKAQHAVREVLAVVADLIPPGVRLAVAGSERVWTLRPVKSDGSEELTSTLKVDHQPNGISISSAGPLPLLGIGPWIPLVPSFLDVKLTAQSALEFIQEVITDTIGTPWPAGFPNVRARLHGGQVHLSFVSADGNDQLPLPALPRTLFE